VIRGQTTSPVSTEIDLYTRGIASYVQKQDHAASFSSSIAVGVGMFARKFRECPRMEIGHDVSYLYLLASIRVIGGHPALLLVSSLHKKRMGKFD